jgi:hypothetical protein
MAELIYFAWVDEGEEFDENVHNRMDEFVFDFTFDHSEGDFAGLQLVIKNPRIGLLNPSRKVWGILSFDDGSTVTPIFRGRLIAVPTNVFNTLVTIDFTARPFNYVEQKEALADTMRVLPYWDPIFITPESWADTDTVLEARSALWHIDPVTHVVTTTDVLVPEDGTEEFTAAQHWYDDMNLTLNQTPLRAVSMVATIPWTQSDQGNVDLTYKIKSLFGIFDNPTPNSFTMEGLISSWPKPGSAFGSGWQVLSGSMTDVSYGIKPMKVEDIFLWQGDVPVVPEGSVIFPLKITGEVHYGETAGYNLDYEVVIAALGYAVPELTITYTAGREFAQIVTFTLQTDQQAIVTLPGEDEAMSISMNANNVSEPTYDASVPIVDVRRRNYTNTERGMQSIEYLLLVARAHLIARSRAVEIAFKTDFKEALRARSLRKAVLLRDPRLPGGQAIGKIVNVRLAVSGESGAAEGEISIACCVGRGGSYVTSPGTPSYVDEGYMDNVQEFVGQVKLSDTEDVQWTVPTPAFFDDGLDFAKGLNANNAFLAASLINGPQSQRAAIEAAGDGVNTDQAKVSSVLQTIPTQISFQMKPMERGPFTQEVVVSVSDLIVPKQIDLEAASNA